MYSDIRDFIVNFIHDVYRLWFMLSLSFAGSILSIGLCVAIEEYLRAQSHHLIRMKDVCLKLGEFQTNTSSSFRDVREQGDFTNVTLVSLDNQYIDLNEGYDMEGFGCSF